MKLNVAAVSWGLQTCTHPDDFFNHLVKLLDQTKSANLVVLPELFSLELCSLFQDENQADLIRKIAPFTNQTVQVLTDFAVTQRLTIVGGSHIRSGSNDEITHGSPLISPNGEIRWQYKNNLTQFEIVDWGVSLKQGLVSDENSVVGTLVCYDCEFPEAGRILAESGKPIIAVPSFTETGHGFWRVRNSCLARAIENQVFVIQAGLVGSFGKEPVPTTYSSSAIIAPSIEPYPANGILAESPLNQESVIFAELDLECLMHARENGDVRNWNDRRNSEWQISSS